MHFKSTHVFKMGASEMNLLTPVFLFFLESVVAPLNTLEAEIASFRAFALILALVKNGKFGRDIDRTAADLLEVFRQHAERFAEAYPDRNQLPKGHWGFHLARQLLRDGFILDCFTGERQNGLLKRTATTVDNTRSFEKTILARFLSDRLHALQDARVFEDGLVDAVSGEPSPGEPSPDLAQQEGIAAAFIGLSLRFRGTKSRDGDIIWVADHDLEKAILIAGAATLDGELALFFHDLEFVQQVTASASRWRRTLRPLSLFRLRGNDIKLSAAFSWETETDVIVLEW